MRTIFAVSGVLILLYNVNHIPIGLANTLFNMSPIFMHFLEALVYKVCSSNIVGKNKQAPFDIDIGMFYRGCADCKAKDSLRRDIRKRGSYFLCIYWNFIGFEQRFFLSCNQ